MHRSFIVPSPQRSSSDKKNREPRQKITSDRDYLGESLIAIRTPEILDSPSFLLNNYYSMKYVSRFTSNNIIQKKKKIKINVNAFE